MQDFLKYGVGEIIALTLIALGILPNASFHYGHSGVLVVYFGTGLWALAFRMTDPSERAKREGHYIIRAMMGGFGTLLLAIFNKVNTRSQQTTEQQQPIRDWASWTPGS